MIDSKTEKLAKEFLGCAKNDLDATKLLHEETIYALSVYHLQQSAEKMIKSWGLYTGDVSIKEIKDCGHKSPKIFFKMVKKWLEENGERCDKFNIGVPLELEKIRKSVRNVMEENRVYAPHELSAKKIREILAFIERTNAFLTDLRIVLIEKIKKMRPELSEKDKKSTMDLISLDITNILDIFWMEITLLFLCEITFVHEETTRYPDGNPKPSDYNRQMGIVEAEPELIRMMECVANVMSSFEGT